MSELWKKPAHEMSRLLASGAISSEELTRAHLDRIEAVDGDVRAFTVVFRDEALAAARTSDEERKRGQVRGPLHGLPISVKESLDYAGQASTLGTTKRRSILAKEDAGITSLLKSAGAVVLGRTNVSQLLLFHESRNPLFGQTRNPWSSKHTPGGSSGGEAAAIAAGMAPLGVGTDIGGSIRVPAHFAGIAGLKPTLDRWTNKGSNGAMMGQEVIRSQLGPMARTARDVALAMSAIDPKAMSAIDPRVPPVPGSTATSIDVRSLRVGVLVDDGLLPVSTAVVRGVREAAEALKSAGAKVVDLPMPELHDLAYAYLSAMTSDGGRTALAWASEDKLDPVLAPMRALASVPRSVRKALASGVRLSGATRLGRFLETVGELSVTEVWALTTKLRAARGDILAKMDAAGVDLILCPAHATTALPHGLARDFTLAGSWSMYWNATQLPGGVVPVTRVRPDEATRADPVDAMDRRAAAVDAASAGLPVGVQVVGRPWEDDAVLAAMIAIEDAVHARPGFPATPVLEA